MLDAGYWILVMRFGLGVPVLLGYWILDAGHAVRVGGDRLEAAVI
ncbi:MAG: hypothetical protein QF473_01310 [Planctomycetota bacterium]|jgi:hypothetical protein|nr:hypothetical protein [Planctomycetota bacterium]MDP6502435.1 hypothetical protein [Planctomycetota bacterium]